MYPLEDHFAEKLHAYTTPRENPSRVKDLVDMLLLIELDLGATDLLRRSIEATFDRYGRHALPQVLPTPPTGWREAFGQLAIEVGLPVRDLDAAYRRLQVFLQAARGNTS